MFTTGSKFLIGATLLAIAAALVYGLTQEGTLGTFGLISAAVALAFLAGVDIAVRDATVAAEDERAVAAAPAGRRAPAGSVWPLGAALGVTAIGIGLVTAQPVVVLGVALVLASAAEWMVQAWSERASADQAFNDDIRERVASPLELPILAAAGTGLLIYSFSRVMLSLSKSGTVAAFATVAAIVLLIGYLIAARPRLSGSTVAGVCSLAVIALVAGGIVAAVDGERTIHPHETTADVAERGRCGAEETEADENASQSVAAKASVTATVTLGADEALSFDQPGYDTPTLQIPRSTPSNVLFRNKSGEERRLVLADVPVGDGTETKTLCTALVEDGGVQLLTIEFEKPSFVVDGGYRFTVPGVESAELEVVVP